MKTLNTVELTLVAANWKRNSNHLAGSEWEARLLLVAGAVALNLLFILTWLSFTLAQTACDESILFG